MEVSASVRIPIGWTFVDADVTVPADARGTIVFAHGSGSSRHSPRNQAVAAVLQEAGFVTVLADLLTPDEEEVDRANARLRFDIGLLADRVIAVTDWARAERPTAALPIGVFGASTGAAAALVAAAERRREVKAVVSRGGRPDLAGALLAEVTAPVLLIVGSQDQQVLELNRRAAAQLAGPVTTLVIPGATHLFEEPGTLDQVASAAGDFFLGHLGR